MNKVVSRLCKRIQKLEAGIAKDFLLIGEILCELYERGWLGEEMSFEDLVEKNFGFSLRTAMNLMSVQHVRVHCGIPDDELIRVGRSKIARLATRLTRENWPTMFEWAARTPFNEIKDWIKTQNMEAGDGRSFRSDPNSGDSAHRTLTFSRKQRELFDEVVDLAREKFDTTNRETALTKLLELVKPLL